MLLAADISPETSGIVVPSARKVQEVMAITLQENPDMILDTYLYNRYVMETVKEMVMAGSALSRKVHALITSQQAQLQ